jgi:hypothetical protein
MKWAVLVARMGEKRNIYRVLVGRTEERRPVGRLGVDRKIILKLTLKEQDGRSLTVLV